MEIKPEQLKHVLKKTLESLYLVFGAELLLVEQSLTQIRIAAKKQGFGDKVSFEIDVNFDWNLIIAEIYAASLFSPKRIIECRLKTGKIGVKGAKALSEIATTLPDDIVLIIIVGKLDSNQQKSKWFKVLKQNGNIVQHWDVKPKYLVGWITNHMNELGLDSNSEVAQSIAFCTQGNLLASMQEIQKLKIAYPDGKIDTKAYLEQANQQSKYTPYGLLDAALLGDVHQVLKIYPMLLSDGVMPIQISNVLYKEIKSLIEMAIELKQVRQIDTIMQNHYVWKNRKPMVTHILKRFSYQGLQKLLLSLGRIERSIKGMDNLLVVNELRTLLLNLAGKTQWNR